MKAWLETRWRLSTYLAMCLICIGVNYLRPSPIAARSILLVLGTILTILAMTVAGAGLKSQAPIGFPEGLAGSTQFTIALPVSRLRLLTIRAVFGLAESCAATFFIGWLAWVLFPVVRASTLPADYARLLLVLVLFEAVPYCATVFFAAFVDEPLSAVFAGWLITFVLWLAHKTGPAVDVVQAWGRFSPVLTHTLPWSQLGVCLIIAALMFAAAAHVVQTREY